MVINQSSENFEISIYGWVVLDNHYHLLIGIWDKKSNEFHPNQRFVFNSSDHSAKVEKNYSKYKLVEFIRKIHKDSARKLNMQDSEKGRIIWYQYWDRIIRTKKEFFGYLNYIHFNPIKHNKVKDFNNLAEYQYSSFIDFLKKYGFSWISDCYEKYSIAD